MSKKTKPTEGAEAHIHIKSVQKTRQEIEGTIKAVHRQVAKELKGQDTCPCHVLYLFIHAKSHNYSYLQCLVIRSIVERIIICLVIKIKNRL